jgi:hypothetical protein
VHKKGVYEREKTVDVVQGWSAVSLIEMKGLFLREDQMIKHIEIDMGSISLNPAQSIQGLLLIEEIQQVTQPHDCVSHFLFINFTRMVPERSLQDSSAIGDLSGENRLRNLC